MKVRVYDTDERQWRTLRIPEEGIIKNRVMIIDEEGNEWVIDVTRKEEVGLGVQLREGRILVLPQSANYLNLEARRIG